jgi:hypothetical protein
MNERRPATTIGELDIHLGFLMQELKAMRERVDGMFNLMATKEELAREIAALRAEVKENSPRSFMRTVTELATGVAAVSAAVGIIAALLHYGAK